MGTDVYFGNGLQKTKVYTYAYDSNGQLISCTDWKNNILTKYKDKITEIWNLSTNTLLQSYGTVNENEKVKKLEKIGSSEFISEHFTDEGKRNISTFKSRQQSTNNFFELSKKSMEYDTFDRIITERYYIPAADTPILTKNYYYLNTENGETTTISGIDIITNNATTNFLYSYDANGNLSSVSKNGNLILRYEYDEIGQLIRYDHADSGHTYTYKYDAGGNLLHKRIFAFTTDDNVGIEQNYIAYNYSNTEWKDQLTSYNGKAITYDSIGNPLTFDGYTYTWEAGRQLAAISGSGQTIVYKYNDNGIRTEKTVNGITTSYTIVDSKITSQKTGNSYIYFHYDSAGELVGMNYAGNEYFYLKDIAGNIIGIVNSSGTVVVQYTYDVWGNLISISGSMANTLGISNPFRYCGYYYDNESGMYYLQSRYYNPEWGRFINADDPSILLTGETGLFGNNLYSYCCNDSVNNIDFSGHVPRNNMNARQRYNANFNIIGNNPRSFQNFINGQGRYPYRNMPFGNYYTDYNGCGWIATYNALRYLCERPFLPNLIRSMEQSCTLLLNGLVGVPPWAVTSQLRLWGYNSKFITVASTKSRYWFLGSAKTIKDFQNTAKSVRAFIMLYRTSGGGAHYVFGRYVNSHKNFVFYNVYSKDSSYRTYFSLYGFVSSSQIVFMITL